MTERAIDYEHGFTGAGAARNPRPHGVVIKSLQDEKKQTIMEVFMYRAAPGVYYNAHGKEVHEALAKRAGYDVERHKRERQHQLRTQAASNLIAQEEGINDGVRRHIVVEEQGGFKLVDIGLGRFWVEDENGPLTKGTHLTRELAQLVFDDCVGAVRKPAAPEGASPSAPAGGKRAQRVDTMGATQAP